MGASVKIMLSYNYCHFEVSKSVDREVTDKQIDEMRKDVQRLADNAVLQYQKAKTMAEKRINLSIERKRLEDEVTEIINNIPESERTAEQKAKIKALDDKLHWDRYNYDYDEDYDDDEF